MRKLPVVLFCVLPLVAAPGIASQALAGCIGQTTATNFVCGMTITESCVMNEDLITTEQICFEVGADDIVIDGNGHSITGPWVYGGPTGGKGVNLMVHENVSILDLTINAFYWGIRIYYGTTVTLEGNSVDDTYFGIELETTTTDSTVENNSVTDCVMGIKVNLGSTDNTFTGNTVSGCGAGVRVYCPGNLFQGNQVLSSEQTGFGVIEVTGGVTTLVGNTVTGSGVDGIYVYESHGTVLRYNQASDNTYCGIAVTDSEGVAIEYNKVSGNGDSGILLAGDAPGNHLVGNKVCDNGDSPSTYDILDEAGNAGHSNTCATASGFNDTDAESGCAFACGCGCDTGHGTVYDCGQSISSSCTLTCDLLSFGSCFSVGKDKITIDGNRFAIQGNGTGNGISALGSELVEIRNFDIADFERGINLAARRIPTPKSSLQNRLLNNRLEKMSLYGIVLTNSDQNTLTNNLVYDSKNGISVGTDSENNVLAGNLAARSQTDGLYFASNADGNTLTGNTLCASGNRDVNNLAGVTNTGTTTTCTTTGGTYHDTGKTGCTYACGICTDGTFFGECSLVKPRYCMEGTLVDDCVRCGCDADACNPETGACEAVPPPDGLCVGATQSFACGDNVTESCVLSDHMGSAGTCLTITANNVTIDGAGFSITGDQTGKGVTTMVHDHIVIRDLTVRRFYTGIDLYYSMNSLIENCSVLDNEGPGIQLRNQTQFATVRGNTLRLNDTGGLAVKFDALDNTVEDNVITDNTRGIWITSGAVGNTVAGNTITDNRFAGIGVLDTGGNTLSGNTLARNTEKGIVLYRTDGNLVEGNNLRHHSEWGVMLLESDDNTFTGNFIADSGMDGVYLDPLSLDNTLTGNTICDNGNGVDTFDIDDDNGSSSGSNNMCNLTQNYDDSDAGPGGGCAHECAYCGCDTGTTIYRCGDTVMESCTLTCDLSSDGTCFTAGADGVTIDGDGHHIVGNRRFDTYGVYAFERQNLTITDLDISEFNGGVYLESTTDSHVTASRVHSNDLGIILAFASGNQIENNTVEDNTVDGIRLAYSSSTNTVSGNTLDGNPYGIRLLFGADLNTLSGNEIRNSGENGIYLDFDTNDNELLSNTVCGNPVDIYEDGANGGDLNTCETTHEWNDDGATGCSHGCGPKRPAAMPWIPLLLLDP